MHRYFVIISLFLFSPLSAFAVEYVFCNTCTTETEFRLHAKGHHGDIVGIRNYQVINYATEELWDVTVEGWRDDFDGVNYYGGTGIFMSTASATPASQQDINDFKAIKEDLKSEHMLVLPPDFLGGESYQGMRKELINAYIAGSPVALTALRKITLWNTIKLVFGFGRTYVNVILNNGDVVKFELINPAGASTCCDYISGSAVDNEGNHLDYGSSPSGGHPNVNYVSVDPITLLSRFSITVSRITYLCTMLPAPRNGVSCVVSP